MNEDAFLLALREDPNDEVTWLALADWLDEHGQADRAELLRLVRRLRTLPVLERSAQRDETEARIAALLSAGVRPVVPEVINSIGMRLALIPPGSFRMGSPQDEEERQGDETPHEVILTRPFYLGVFTVTQGQYDLMMAVNPSHFSRDGSHSRDVAGLSDEELADLPVEGVSWEDAQAFLTRLSERAAREGERLRYRLPSEAEWEYACRAGTTTPFHFGRSLSSLQANFRGGDPYGGGAVGPDLDRTCKVGSYRPNAFGLYDMHGNVYEYVQDAADDYPAGPATDPAAAGGELRISRGGSWAGGGEDCRSASRGGDAYDVDDTFSDVGFRVAAEPMNDR
jgi:uncharacterized protein (TIGR02996 family)